MGEAGTSPMVGALVAASIRRAWLTLALGLVLAGIAGAFAATHFRLSSDTEQLISHTMDWRRREAQFNALFQPDGDQIVVVVDGATPELAEQGAAALAARLQARPDLFRTVRRPDAIPFFQKNGLLYEDAAAVRAQMAQLVAAQPFLGPLAADPSLRGLAATLSTAVQGVTAGQASLADLRRPIAALGDTLAALQAGRPAVFSWRALIAGKPPTVQDRRQIVLAAPRLDFARLQSGEDATRAIRAAA
ncbi:MAG: hypothetical protein JOZ27_05885, partial [Caulobacteraceae bacterium]|nr:hypothetical protein [Caulobacteraceae bacterium]